MTDLEIAIFDALYQEGFSKAGSSGKHTEHLAKAIAREVEAHFAFVRRAESDLPYRIAPAQREWKGEKNEPSRLR